MFSIDVTMLIDLMDMYVSIDVMMMIAMMDVSPPCYLLALFLVHNEQ